VSPTDPAEPAAAARRTDTLMREARSVLRRLDKLSGSAAEAEPAIRRLLDESVAAVERLTAELAHQQQVQRRRLQEALRSHRRS
jgi:predicted  nucleic acid-binding Zn-ribbon protein